MKIENYKGVDILHDAKKDEFYTNIVIRKGEFGRKSELISAPRLQKTRDEIDKFLNTAAKKPVLKKAWLRYHETYEKVEVVLFNSISETTQIKKSDGRTELLKEASYRNDEKLFLSCKENDSIIEVLNKKQKEIEKIRKEISCSGGKLIPLSKVHFS